MLNVIDLNLENFKKYNYMVYEQRFFPNMIEIYDENNIKYKYLGEDVFKKKYFCPILVDLNSISEDIKQSFLEELVLNYYTRFVNYFDDMYIAQNLIKSTLDLDEMADLMVKLMVVGNSRKSLFRFYDPRVSLHLNALMYDENKIYKNIFSGWKEKFLNNFDEYIICINGEFRGLNLNQDDFIYNKKLDISLIDDINLDIKKEINEMVDNLRKLPRKEYFIEIVSNVYKKYGVI
jgi:hypothetical protein